jgi:hypothetical protein
LTFSGGNEEDEMVADLSAGPASYRRPAAPNSLATSTSIHPYPQVTFKIAHVLKRRIFKIVRFI